MARAFDQAWKEALDLYLEAFLVIDWFLQLPPDLERRIEFDISAMEREKTMPLPLNRYERNAIEQGRREGRQEVVQNNFYRTAAMILKTKLGEAGVRFAEGELTQADADLLEKISVAALGGSSIEELRALIGAPA